MVKGFDLALEMANYEIAGRKVEVILEDDAGKAELAQDKARKLVEQDKVDMIVGPTLAGLQIGVANYCNQVKMPNINTNTSPYAIIAQKLAWTIQCGGSQLQVPSCSGKYNYEKKNIKKLTLIGEDTAAGHGYCGAFIGGFKNAGGQIIQEQWVPQGTADYGPYFAAAKPADGCVVWTSGNDSVKFLNQYQQFGMWDKMPLVPAYQGAIIESFILAQLQPAASEACIGMETAVNFSPFFPFASTKKFVDAFRAKNNQYPDSASSSAYNAVIIIIAGLEATGGDTDPQKFMDAMLSTNIELVDGPTRFDKEKKSAIKDVNVSKLEKVDKNYLFTAPIFTYKDVPPEGL